MTKRSIKEAVNEFLSEQYMSDNLLFQKLVEAGYSKTEARETIRELRHEW